MSDAQAVFTSGGTPATSGVCPVCETKMFRMGRTDAHEGLQPPEVKRKSKHQTKKSGKMVIVESPAKARTVGRFLGKGFEVMASVGHVRDLLRSQLSVDIDNDFQPRYRVPNEKRKVVKQLKSAANKAEEVYLATDPDREGEAIAWHLVEAVDIPDGVCKRVVFHEITEPAIKDAFARAHEINMDLVNAQQARRILDRLVGYNLSPLLWRKVRSRLSAGRVQSVALRLIVEREREIDAFIPEEFWTIAAEFQPQDRKESFIAKLIKVDQDNIKLGSELHVKPLLEDMQAARYQVSDVKLGQRKRRPSAPYTTSTLQQEASRRLGFTTRRTMRIAQQLYEGIDLDEGGLVGLITYMRTDSTNVSKLAQQEARKFIVKRYGEKFAPKKSPRYKPSARQAQEAHEAIRPTSVLRKPKALKKYLSRDQYRLYNLIWMRFVASQMSSAVYDTVSVEVSGEAPIHKYLLKATGSSIRFPGFMILYEEVRGMNRNNGDNGDTPVPTNLAVGEQLDLLRLIPEQHFTQPPPRFSEASLVKALEEYGIGRPSTYAPIISTIQNRGYVEKDDRRLCPTETGFVVNDLLVEHFPDVMSVNFTAQMEKRLDSIADGENNWVSVIHDFYQPFSERVKKAEANIPEMKMEYESVGRSCPESGHDLVIRWGRYGKFISCSNFPECRYTEPWLEKVGVQCPNDGGEIVERRTRKGRIFYGCENYPDCDFTSWKRPLPEPCPNCEQLLVTANKQYAQCTVCEERFKLESLPVNEQERELESA
jgi:DNA topoisomerase-1